MVAALSRVSSRVFLTSPAAVESGQFARTSLPSDTAISQLPFLRICSYSAASFAALASVAAFAATAGSTGGGALPPEQAVRTVAITAMNSEDFDDMRHPSRRAPKIPDLRLRRRDRDPDFCHKWTRVRRIRARRGRWNRLGASVRTLPRAESATRTRS